MGYDSYAYGDYSIALGSTTTNSYGSVAIGLNNKTQSGSEDTWVATDPVFVVGNGDEYNSSYGDALIVYKNGNMTLKGNLTSNGTSSSSDLRLKKDIQSLNGSLDKVLKLRGVSFYWKSKDEMAAAKGEDVNNMSYGFSDEKQIGVIAQEVEEVLPELVVTDNEGFKAVKYENLTPVLIEAVKELKAEKDELQKEEEELKRMVEELMKR